MPGQFYSGRKSLEGPKSKQKVSFQIISPPTGQVNTMSSLDLDECLSCLYAGQILSMTQVRYICRRLIEELLESPNIVQVSLPVSIVGDIHG